MRVCALVLALLMAFAGCDDTTTSTVDVTPDVPIVEDAATPQGDADATPADTSEDAATCVTGAVGCECFGNNSCNTGLYCDVAGNTCVDPGCTIGADGCRCFDDGTCNEGIDCVAGTCALPPCPDGSLGCACFGNGTCEAGLTCESDTCIVTPCVEGELGCPCVNGTACTAGLSCSAGTCTSPDCPSGLQGCPCKSDGSCSGDLECTGFGASAVCDAPASCVAGTAECPCTIAGTCEDGLFCDSASTTCKLLTCVPGAAGCICNNGACDGNGVFCDDVGFCQQAECQAGGEGCACAGGNSCGLNTRNEEMVCESGICVAPSCSPGDTGCPCIYGADCVSSGDSCTNGFCQPEGCAIGSLNCSCSAGSCVGGATCRDSAICVDNTGFLGGACLPDLSCAKGSKCQGLTCVLCNLGEEDCACIDDTSCNAGLECFQEVCRDPSKVNLPSSDAPCYTKCQGSLVDSVTFEFLLCPEDGLMDGCHNGLVCNDGSCVEPGQDPPTCSSDLDCLDFQACMGGSCYSNCDVDSDCTVDGYVCDRKVCRKTCATDGDECEPGEACLADDGVSGTCHEVAGATGVQDNVYAGFEVSHDTITMSNIATTFAFALTNDSEALETFTVRKFRQQSSDEDGNYTVITDPHDDDVACDISTDCPLVWLHMGEEGNAAPQQEFEIFVPAGETVVLELANGGGSTEKRWDGIVEIIHPVFGTRQITVNYAERPEGRWNGTVSYFATFGDTLLDEWVANPTSQAAIEAVGNAFIQSWAAFRLGDMQFEEFEAILTATREESWKWATVQGACDEFNTDPTVDIGCYLYDNSAAGVSVYSSNLDSTPIPTGVIEMPIAMNLYMPEGAPEGTMTGKIVTAEALQYPGNPSVALDFGSDVSGCDAEIWGTCLVFLENLQADVLVGGRFTTDGGNTSCAPRDDGTYEKAQIPWLLPGFERATEVDPATGLRYRYECRDTLLPDTPPEGETLSAVAKSSNMSLSLANPIPDGRTRRRVVTMLDGALINQTHLFIIFKETYKSFLTGDSEDDEFSAYGYMLLKRDAIDLDVSEKAEDGTPLPYKGATAVDERPDPAAPVLGLSCSEEMVGIALDDVTIDNVTSSNAARLVQSLIDGYGGACPAGSSCPLLITETSDEAVHYLCHDTGLFDGGSGAVTSVWDDIPNDDGCDFASSGDNFYDDNGVCDDGGPDSETSICPLGTDVTDCGTRKAAQGDFREECPAGSDVTFFTVTAALSQADIAAEACNTVDEATGKGTCDQRLAEWQASQVVIQLDPTWRCSDPNEVYCDTDRYDLRAGKEFLAKEDPSAVLPDLYTAIDLAFRYKTKFVNRDGKNLGFTPAQCAEDADETPYCYDPPEIEGLRERIDCLLYIWENHYDDVTNDPDFPDSKEKLDLFLCTNFAYTEGCIQGLPDNDEHEGFERLYAELLVMLGDASYVNAFASRFDLAGLFPVSFEGSLFEDGGINLSGAAGYEMYNLYQATQYYQEALDRFFATSGQIFKALDFGFSKQNFVTQETVVRYFERLIRASTQKSRAWSEISKRYQSFNEAGLARSVIERAYSATYIENIMLAQLMTRITKAIDPNDVPQIRKVIEDSSRRYRMALLDMQNVYAEISDEVRLFGFAPEYVPFPALSDTDPNAFEVMLARVDKKLTTAKFREDAALERSKAFETDANEFQNELVRLRNTYESQLGDICGVFEVDGEIYPAIPKYAELEPNLAKLANPCGMLQQGQVADSMGQYELIALDLQRIRTQIENTISEASIEKSRVEAQCGVILSLADYKYEVADKVQDLQTAIAVSRQVVSGIDRAMGVAGQLAQLANCNPVAGSCALAAVAATALGAAFAAGNTVAWLAEGAIAGLELEISQIEQDAAYWEAATQCDMAQIDANARMATILLRLKELELEGARTHFNMRLLTSQVKQQLNTAKRVQDELEEAEQLVVNSFAARNDPNVRIYRDDAVVNAEISFTDALRAAYQLTKVYEYYTSQTYVAQEQLFLIRMVQFGDYNLQNYVTDLENAFFEFEGLYGLPNSRVALVSLRNDILNVPDHDETGAPLNSSSRINLMREALQDPALLDKFGYLSLPFSTRIDELSPLTRNHKIDFVEAEIIGSDVGDVIGRLYLRQRGTATVNGVTDDKYFYRFPNKTAVLNPYFNGNKIFDIGVYRNKELRDRPFLNTAWELVINQRDESANKDINLQSLTDIRLYIYYTDFTAL